MVETLQVIFKLFKNKITTCSEFKIPWSNEFYALALPTRILKTLNDELNNIKLTGASFKKIKLLLRGDHLGVAKARQIHSQVIVHQSSNWSLNIFTKNTKDMISGYIHPPCISFN